MDVVDRYEDAGGGRDYAAEPYEQAMFYQINSGFETLNVGLRCHIVMDRIEYLRGDMLRGVPWNPASFERAGQSEAIGSHLFMLISIRR
jgi:hypothetical protein